MDPVPLEAFEEMVCYGHQIRRDLDELESEAVGLRDQKWERPIERRFTADKLHAFTP
jgi:hypothetical protein